MAPITFSSSSSSSSSMTTVPLNQSTAYSVLSNPRSDDWAIAAIFQDAFCHQDILNETIKSILTEYGSFSVSERVKTLLFKRGIELVQHSDATISMCYLRLQDEIRHDRIEDVLSAWMPKDLTNLVNSYEGEQIEFRDSIRNRFKIKFAFESSEPVIKTRIIREAIQHGKEAFLNEIFREIRLDGPPILYKLDLSHVNLSGLNLGKLLLMHANLTCANLAAADLSYASLRSSNLTGANLTDTNLTGAELTDANLTKATLTNSNLTAADLTNATLTGANLVRANLLRANLHRASLLGADLTHANLFQAKLTDTQMPKAPKVTLPPPDPCVIL